MVVELIRLQILMQQNTELTRLSITITVKLFSNNSTTQCDPIYPEPPVIKTLATIIQTYNETPK
ncbi:hypothetical protein DERP_009129 [Dermatophagoides pteronyssinus]|uniref:Uncharacterized protein n=1 Tax=Dermatophagoides pteronyssinus TaxID=6956 RepID=A0ABQ8JQV0_DERPT|nr:hypothetical protein DERP_009129 [Dermatophagoides pteronyssinus]